LEWVEARRPFPSLPAKECLPNLANALSFAYFFYFFRILKYDNVIIINKGKILFFLVGKWQLAKSIYKLTRDNLQEDLSIHQELYEYNISQNINFESFPKDT
jgi:hypothetical protein